MKNERSQLAPGEAAEEEKPPKCLLQGARRPGKAAPLSYQPTSTTLFELVLRGELSGNLQLQRKCYRVVETRLGDRLQIEQRRLQKFHLPSLHRRWAPQAHCWVRGG